MKQSLFILTIMTLSIACKTENKDIEKEAIYLLLEKFDSFYLSGHLCHEYEPNDEWVFYSNSSQKFEYPNTFDGYRQHLKYKLKELRKNEIFTNDFLSLITNRYDSDTSIINMGILFTDNEYGDYISNILVPRNRMDYLVDNSPEFNPFEEVNAKLTNEEFIEWQKNRINIISNNHAEFKVLYTEVGFPYIERSYNFVITKFIKENENWKINDIRIQEATHDEMINFYKSQVEMRGYYN
jgi:hypothetical protein